MSNKFVAIIAAAIMLTISVCMIVLPKSDFSENENRVLQKLPEFSGERLVSGEFTDEIENYINDHFPGRDAFVSIKGNFQKAIGYREMNETFIAGNRLLQHIKEPKTGNFISKVNRLVGNLDDSEATVRLMVVPTDAGVYNELLPQNAPDVVDEEAKISEIYDGVSCEGIDILSALIEEKDNGNNLFYNLDHHWTYYGAYIGYKTYMESLGMTPGTLEDIPHKVVSEEFRGTLYSKVLIGSMPSDSITAVDFTGMNLTVTNVDKNEVRDTYYYEEFLNKKDKYCYFGGGNPGKMIIENPDATYDREVLVVKDSFANSLIPFLIGDFKKVHIIDPRYYVRHISDCVVDDENITDVLILYNLDSLSTNNGIIKLK